MTAAARVLVVEDDVEIREILVEILAEHGYEPFGAANGRDALDLLRAPGPRPSLILLDLMMPVMDGPAFRRAQLESPELACIPVVAISAYRDVDRQAERLGVEHLNKPIKLAQLLDVAHRHCRASAPRG